jgi:hypothetical protein
MPHRIPIETEIFTVAAAAANEEIKVRQAFGWNLVGTSARSYATGGTIVGGGMGASIAVGGGTMQFDVRHLTDLTMERAMDARRPKLRALENEYDSLAFKDTFGIAAWGALAAFIAIPAAASIIVISANLGALDYVVGYIFMGLAAGAVPSWLVGRAINRPKHRYNEWVRRRATELIQMGQRIA